MFSPDGTFYGAISNSLYTIDPSTAAASAIGTFNPVGQLQALAFSLDGTFYGAISNSLYTIDPSTAAATEIGTLRFIGEPQALAFSPDGTVAVPLPSTICLFLTGLSMVGVVACKRRGVVCKFWHRTPDEPCRQ